MNTEKASSLLFARENIIFWIISAARIVSWIVLVTYLIVFASQLQPLFQGGVQLPREFFEMSLTIVNWVYPLLIGAFYFLVLQGIAQGLNLGLDIYYELQPEGENIDEEINQE